MNNDISKLVAGLLIGCLFTVAAMVTGHEIFDRIRDAEERARAAEAEAAATLDVPEYVESAWEPEPLPDFSQLGQGMTRKQVIALIGAGSGQQRARGGERVKYRWHLSQGVTFEAVFETDYLVEWSILGQ